MPTDATTATPANDTETASPIAAHELTPHDVIAANLGPDVARMALDALELHMRRHLLPTGTMLGTIAFDGDEFVFLAIPFDGEVRGEAEAA